MLDLVIHQFFVDHANPALGRLAMAASFFSDFKTIIFILSLVLLIYLFKKNRFFVFWAFSLATGGLITQILKYSVLRERPVEVLYGIHLIDYSFPSGHAVASVIMYGFLGYYFSNLVSKKVYKYIIYILSFLLIILISVSRLVLGVHWLSDVLAGWIIGGLILGLTIRFFKKD